MHFCQAQTTSKCFSFYPSFRVKVNLMECSLLKAHFARYFSCTWHLVPSVAHLIKPPAQPAHLLLCIASWDWGSDKHTGQRKRENHHACRENIKKGCHKLNSSIPHHVMQRILPPLASPMKKHYQFVFI